MMAVRETPEELPHEILADLRRIIRSISIDSRKLLRDSGLTMPQLLCLRVVENSETPDVTSADLSRALQLSPATVTGIVDRLEAAELLKRVRDSSDRRKVNLHLTAKGRAKVRQTPPSLQDRFVARVVQLDGRELRALRRALRRIVELMGTESLEAAPILTTEEIGKPAQGT
jgi:DNA-binding MarR family transcriptional regulator